LRKTQRKETNYQRAELRSRIYCSLTKCRIAQINGAKVGV